MPHQIQALEQTQKFNKVAYYHDMGLGKTYTGAEKALSFDAPILVICQKSKVDDWVQHFGMYLPAEQVARCVYAKYARVTVINYDLVWRRPDFLKMKDFTLLLDESSLIKNKSTKRTKFIMNLKYSNLVLLSGTPCAGKYEELLTQINMLGWNISEKDFWERYVKYYTIDVGFPMKVATGYKNVDELKERLRRYGAVFLMTDEVLELPEQRDVDVMCSSNALYKRFMRDSYVEIGDKELMGDSPLKRLLYARMLASSYNEDKKRKLIELLESTSKKMIIFYQFDIDLQIIRESVYRARGIKRDGDGGDIFTVVNGSEKRTDGDIVAVQYQAGAMGLNMQDRDICIYFTLPLSSDLYSQSRKRIHRIGQRRKCLYYHLIARGTVEEDIKRTLDSRIDYNLALFSEI